jgi:hypothetical protein
MPQVLNRSKNASTLINGVQFTKTAKGMLSAEITQEQADYFLKMTNYVAVKAAPQAKPQAVPEQDSADAEAAANAAAAERQAAADAAESAERQAAAEAAAAAAAKQKA